jgi:hypothetical protein
MSFIEESIKRGKKQQKEYQFGTGYVFVKDPLPDSVDVQQVIDTVEKIIPFAMRHMIETIMIGNFQEFEERRVNAVYKGGSIYITNAQTNNDDMVDDLVHEIAHAVEDEYGYFLYGGDRKLVEEFTRKRLKLKSYLESENISTDGFDFADVEYNLEFDDYLFQTVGYPMLTSLSVGLFPDAYSPTSIREYFATGFEVYFLGDRNYLRRTSPTLYGKIKEILEQ